MEEDKHFSYNSTGPITCVCMHHGKFIKFMFRKELKPLIAKRFYYSKCHNLYIVGSNFTFFYFHQAPNSNLLKKSSMWFPLSFHLNPIPQCRLCTMYFFNRKAALGSSSSTHEIVLLVT